MVLTCGRTFARGYRLQQPSAQRHRGLTADGLAVRADGSTQVSGMGKSDPGRDRQIMADQRRWPRLCPVLTPQRPVTNVSYAATI